MLQCPRWALCPPRGGGPKFCTASGGVEADESVFVEQHNLHHTFAVDGIGVSLTNGSFSI